MVPLADLQNAISGLLNLPGIPSVLQLNAPTRERAFEAYVLSLISRAIRQAGGAADLYGRNSGANPSTVIFRGSPGRLGSKAQDFAYVRCSLGQRQFEIHVDVQYEGSSGAIHEADVSIYDHSAATEVRWRPSEFARCRKLYGVIECKFYDSSLGTNLGRTFVGLVADFGTLKFKAFVTNGHSSGLARYFGHGQRPDCFLRLSPIHSDVETRFIGVFEQAFRQWAQVG